MAFRLVADYHPRGDQEQAIEQLVRGVADGERHQVLLGVTGSGKTFTMAKVMERVGRPSLVLARPSFGMSDPRAWDMSVNLGGSPGGPEPLAATMAPTAPPGLMAPTPSRWTARATSTLRISSTKPFAKSRGKEPTG